MTTSRKTNLNRLSRRRFLANAGGGLSALAINAMLTEEARSDSDKVDASNPSASRQPHHAAKAKNVIVVFCSGALSHVDTFDYKPELVRRHGQPMPGNEKLVSFQAPTET